jgi:ClpP class serine protease
VNRARTPYVLDARALQLAGAACRPLALWTSSLGLSFSSLPASSVVPSGVRLATGDDEDEDEDGDEDALAEALGGVALVRIQGPLAQRGTIELCAVVDGYDWVTARFAMALEAGRAVVLMIDSPGGDGAGLAEAVRRMRAMADDAGKPVLAYVDELAASAAYWIAAGVADKVFVPETGRVGSIGAIAVHVDVTAAAEQDGYKYTLVRDPSGKAAGSMFEKLDDTARSRIERDVSDLAGRFAEAMSERRGIALKAVRALDADVLQGTAAVTAGLADGVATLEQVISMAAAAADERDRKMKLKEALGQLLKTAPNASDEDLAKSAQAAAPVLELGRAALALTSASTPEEASAALVTMKRDAEGAAQLRVAEEQRKRAEDDKRRLAAVQKMVAGGAVMPAKAKRNPGHELALGNVAEPWASMPLDMLEATAAAIAPAAFAPLGGVEQPAESREQAAAHGAPVMGLTEEERHVAELMQLDPKTMAENKAREERDRIRDARLAAGRN